MSRKLAPFLLTAAVTLTLSGAAFARRPPALAQREDAVARVLDQCHHVGTSGYRDMLMRLEPRGTAPVAAPMAERRRSPRYIVITCAGEAVHASAGYRDILLRFEPDSSRSMAGKPPASGF